GYDRAMQKHAIPALLLCAFLAACGGSTPEPEAPDSTPQDPTYAGAAGSPGDASGEQSCGGFTMPNAPGCGEGDFCAYPLEAHCGAADPGGGCRQIPQACTREYSPVCGCDGETHANPCVARSTGTAIAA